MKSSTRHLNKPLNNTFVLMLVILFSSVPQKVPGQNMVDIFGYFESTLTGSHIDNSFYQLNSNKLRIDLKADVSEQLSFAANFNYINYNGKTRWNILEFLSKDITRDIPPELREFYFLTFSERNFLDNAWFKLALEKLDITVGKQQLSLGTGYVWNPTDIFNIKDPLDPTYEQPGHNAVRVDVPLGTENTFTLLYSPDEDWQKSAKLILFKSRLSHFDISLLAIESYWLFYDYTQIDALKLSFEELPQRRRLFGLSTAGELLGVGLWSEYAYNNMDNFKNFYEWVVGIDYTFDSQTYLMLEYYRNMLGKTDYKDYTINDWMRQFTSEQKAISRDQLYALLQHPLTDFLTFGSSFIYSISDNSLAIVPTLNYSFFENMDIMAYLNGNFGKDGTVYSKNSGNGGLIRARVYF